MTGDAPRVWALEITDIAELPALQTDARMEHARTRPGAFRMALRGVDVGPLRLQANRSSNGYIARGAQRPDRYGLLFVTGGPSGGSKINGFAPDPDDLVLTRPGAEILSHTAPGQAWAALVLDREVFGPALEAFGSAGAESAFARGRLRAAPGLRRLALEIERLSAADPARLTGGGVAAAIVEGVSAGLAAAFAAAPDRGGRQGRRQLRLVASAAEFLEGALGRPVYSAEVAAALGVSPRALHEAFATVYGMSPLRYLRLRRLHLARRRLLAPEERALVKTVALDMGFWHLGRFAQDYRALFGETPSETVLARG